MAQEAVPLRVGAGVAVLLGTLFEVRLEVVEHQEETLGAHGFHKIVAHRLPARCAAQRRSGREMDPSLGRSSHSSR